MEKRYTQKELHVICAARLLPETGTVFVYLKEHLQAALVARGLHAPELRILTPYGFWGARTSGGMGTTDVDEGMSTLEVFEFLQGGYVDIGFVGGEQVDRFGNVNSWMSGTFKKPKQIFGGGGIGCDVANLAGSVFIMASAEKLQKCDVITAPGFLKGGDSRLKEMIVGDGPKYLISDVCVFDFHAKSKKAQIYALFPGVTKKEVSKKIGWKAIAGSKIPEIYEPTEEELGVLRRV